MRRKLRSTRFDALGAKEIAQQVATTLFRNAADHLGSVVAGGLFEKPRPVLDPAAFRIIGAENHLADAGECDRSRAHRTWFQGNIEVARDQSGNFQASAGVANHKYFRMCRRITVHLNTIAGCCEYDTGRGINDDGADRNFSSRRRQFSLFNGRCQEVT